MAPTTRDTQGYLIDKFGPLLTLEEVADLLRRSPKALATSLTLRTRRDHPYIACLRSAIVRIGRRRLFRAADIAAIIDGEGVKQ